jgi:methyl-accepting chemotaxis protein
VETADVFLGQVNQSITVQKNVAVRIISGILLTGLLFFWSLSVLLVRSITKPINNAIRGLTEVSEQVGAASGEVSNASQELAAGASRQAAAVEQTSSSLEEMASMTKQNAENADQANRLMAEAKATITQANTSMESLTASMGDISKASEETQKIIKTIDEVAFQTNLLALNAAVEAARAGEAGAGFAVVADEVRNLARRAAEAAKNTAVLIETTVKTVHEGANLVGKTNGEFIRVSQSASKVGELVGEIAAASQEQAQGIDQVNKAVAEMDKVIQQNAASAEESASASREMTGRSEQMKGFVEDLAALVGGGARTGFDEPEKVEKPRRKLGALIASRVPVFSHKAKKESGIEFEVDEMDFHEPEQEKPREQRYLHTF